MKELLKSIRNKFVLLSFAMCSAMSAFAQDDQSANDAGSKHHLELYSGILPYLVFGVVILFLGYISYRYWKDNREITE